ncbi:MAG: rubrerythrin family protein, partial [Clostridia bacterium]|nr:rubrerythrin family protein [Clostridia bacterium]
MQFDETKTYRNLARSFAGESQAGMRYQLIARAANEQGYVTLSDTIKILAKNETVHARRFFEELNKHGQYLDNIDLDAGYPFHGGDIAECLKHAADDERNEHHVIKPKIKKKAE